MRTIAPASRLGVSSGTTRKQLEQARAAMSPEPCQETRLTSGRLLAPPKVHVAGKKRVSPGLPCLSVSAERRARAKRGPVTRLPASAASTGAAKSRKVTAEEKGSQASPK